LFFIAGSVFAASPFALATVVFLDREGIFTPAAVSAEVRLAATLLALFFFYKSKNLNKNKVRKPSENFIGVLIAVHYLRHCRFFQGLVKRACV
jgi:hypothetical protein